MTMMQMVKLVKEHKIVPTLDSIVSFSQIDRQFAKMAKGTQVVE